LNPTVVGATSPRKFIEVRLEQAKNVPFPIVVTLLGMEMEVREKQEENRPSPRMITLSGMVKEAKEVQ
jgi:hypothetical protein